MKRAWLLLAFLLGFEFAQAKEFSIPIDPQALIRSKYHIRERGGIVVGNDFVLALTSRGWLVKADFDGKLLWRIPAECKPVNSPAIDDSNLYYACANGTLMARSIKTGEDVWRFKYSDSVASLPAFAQDRLVFQTGSGMVYCLNKADGALRWISRHQGRTRLSIMGASQPLIIGDRVYLGLVDGFVAELKMDDGSLVWKKEVFSRTFISDIDYQLVADQDTLYASSLDGICALSKNTGKVFWCVKENIAGDYVQDDEYIYAMSKEKQLMMINKITGMVEKRIQIPKTILAKWELEKILALTKNQDKLILVSSRRVLEIKAGEEKPRQILRFREPVRAGVIFGDRLFLLSPKGEMFSRGLK